MPLQDFSSITPDPTIGVVLFSFQMHCESRALELRGSTVTDSQCSRVPHDRKGRDFINAAYGSLTDSSPGQ